MFLIRRVILRLARGGKARTASHAYCEHGIANHFALLPRHISSTLCEIFLGLVPEPVTDTNCCLSPMGRQVDFTVSGIV